MFVSQRSHSTRFSASRTSAPRPFLTRDASWMRFMARFALTSWFLPLLFALFVTFTAKPAMAQTPPQTVVVLDFAVADGLDPLLGRKAADGLAVELQRSGDYEVVTRQRVEEAVGQQAGLQPPFNDTAQIRLAQAVGATGVFSGKVVSVELTPGRAARVGLQTKQLDAATGDFINGTQVTETTEQKLSTVANEILVDEAINKSVFSAVRSMRQTSLPEGAVLNTTKDDVELSIGSRNGVSVGQRYSVLRDVFNRAKQITERVKIGELTISRIESDQSVGVLSAGGAAGIRTGDRIRQIFVPINYPVTSTSGGGSVTPVTAPPVTSSNSGGGIANKVKNSSKGLLGLVGLAALVGFAGLGGGGNNTSTPNVTLVRSSSVRSLGDGDFGYFSTSNSLPLSATISFNSGFKGFNLANDLQTESVVGYLIYRGTSPGFSADITNLQGFLDGRNATSASQKLTYVDPQNSTPTRRRVIITSVDAGADNPNAKIEISDSLFTTGADSLTQTRDEITLDFTQRPLVIGQTYYYRVARVTADRSIATGGNTGGNNNSDDVTITLLPVESRVSSPTKGFTALVQPVIQPSPIGYDTDNFSVSVGFDPTFFLNDFTFTLPATANVGTGADQFRIQVSTSTTFTEATTFTSSDLAPTTPDVAGTLTFDLGDIRIPNRNGSYEPGVTPLYVRVLARNSSDGATTFRVSNTLSIGTARGANSTSSRFLASPDSGHGGGVNILGGRGGSRQAASNGASTPRNPVLRPR